MFFTAYCCSAQSVSDLFREFSHAENVEKVNLNCFIMTLVRPFMSSASLHGMKVRDIKVLDLSECDSLIKREYSEMVKSVDDGFYETIVQTNDGDETVKVLAINDGENIKELVVLTTGNDATYVRLRGSFNIADAQKFAEKH